MDPLKPLLHKEEQDCGSKSNPSNPLISQKGNPQENVTDPFLEQERNLQDEGIDPSSKSGCKSNPQENVTDTFFEQERNVQEEGINPSSQSNLHNPLLRQETSPIQGQNHSLTLSIVTHKYSLLFLFILLYISAGAIIYRRETNSLVDALYLAAVTMSTVGYGDIAPHSIFTKCFTIVFSLLGIGILDFILSDVVNEVSGLLLAKIQATFVDSNRNFFTNCIIDFEKRRLRISTKVGVALAFVILFSAMGAVILSFVERLSWTDSFYVSMMSSTTVGYGDMSFQTTAGRLFALVWVLPSTLAVARLFVTVADAREAIAFGPILNREISIKDLVGVNFACKCNGFVRFEFFSLSLSDFHFLIQCLKLKF